MFWKQWNPLKTKHGTEERDKEVEKHIKKDQIYETT